LLEPIKVLLTRVEEAICKFINKYKIYSNEN
jgi:hypothetical protein